MAEQSNALVSIRRELTSAQMTDQFRAALPQHIPVEKFQRVAITAVSMNPDILAADQRSLFAAAMRAAQDGLLPDGREAALVVFNKKDGGSLVKHVQYMPMLAGVLKKIRNSGQLRSICAEIVYEKDDFAMWTDEQGRHFTHRPQWFGDRGEPIGVYAHAVTTDGGVYIEVMSRTEVERVRAVSRAKDSGPWVQWWEEMARKTVLRRLSKYLPSSSDVDFGDDEFDLAQPRHEPAPERPVEQAPADDPPPRQRRIQAVAGGRGAASVQDAEIVADPAPEPPPLGDDDIPL